jgi:rubrerythrin
MDNKNNSKDASQYRNEQKRYDQDNTPYKTLQEALKLVKGAVQGEKEDEIFYNYLISKAPTEEEKRIISDIRDDEIKHNKMFREIYTYFTGEELPKATQGKMEEPKSYLDGVRKALFGELSAMERYRIIRAGLPNRYYRDMVFEILTDEMKHADKYNYILNMNSMDFDRMKSMQADYDDRFEVRIRNVDDDRDQDEEDDRYRHNNSYNEEDNDEDKSDYENKKGNQDENNNMGEDNIPQELLDYIEPIVAQALKEAKAGKDLRYLFQKYILIGILIGNGFTGEQGVEQVKAWDSMILAG